MSDRFKFRVWDKYTHETPAEQMQFLCFNGCLVDCDGCHHSPDDYIVEQCTGLRDKNGNMIYEGDILDCELQDIDSHGYPFIHFKKGVVKRAKNGTYCVEGDDDFYVSDITLYPIEIIGNIHEQGEQKD